MEKLPQLLGRQQRAFRSRTGRPGTQARMPVILIARRSVPQQKNARRNAGMAGLKARSTCGFNWPVLVQYWAG
jgi:hypothetical protein